jgi:hypothetical protein
VSTVSSSALLRCLVDLDVLDDQVACVKTLGIGVCLSILEETEDELGRLDGPSCAGDAELLSCRDIPSASSQASQIDGVQEIASPNHTLCSTSSSTSISSHRNCLLVLLYVLKELDCALQLPSRNRLRNLAAVFE